MEYRILTVEFSKDFTSHISKQIRDLYPVSIDKVNSIDDARIQIDYFTYNLVFQEIHPEISGNNLISYISKSFLNSNTPLILVTEQKNVQKMKEKIANHGIVEIIPNNIDEKGLSRLIQMYFHFLRICDARFEEYKTRIGNLEADLKKYKDYFRNIIDKSNFGILILDQEGSIQFINEAGGKIFLRNRDELTGSNFGIFTGNHLKSEISIVRKNGEIGTGEITTVDTEWKEAPARLVFIHDITHHKKLEENLAAAKIKAQESDRLKTAFLANMSHEIRTPMNAIIGFLDLLKDPHLSLEERTQFFDVISKSGDRLLNTINDIIEISIIESGQAPVTLSAIDLFEEMNNILSMFIPEADKKGLTLKLSGDVLDMKITMRTDKNKLSSILSNIIKNAVKFTESGFVECGCRRRNGEILFYVNDTGMGIPSDRLGAIFDRFVQADLTSARPYEGSGLGLSIAKAYVEMLGGKIWAESKIGKGSTFFFTVGYLPVEKKTEKNEEINIEENLSNSDSLILVAEDDDASYYLLEQLLTAENFKLLRAMNGNDAVSILKQNPEVDIVLMDAKMPGMDGYEATRQIRKFNKEIPIIAQTAYALAGDNLKALEAGCNDYLSKPIRKKELIKRIRNNLRK